MKKSSVRLTEAQCQDLQHLIYTGIESACRLLYARVLLKADQGANGRDWTDEQISAVPEVSPSTLVLWGAGTAPALTCRSLSRTCPRRLEGEHWPALPHQMGETTGVCGGSCRGPPLGAQARDSLHT